MFEHTKAFSGFSVDDTEQAKQFYGGVLGLQVSEGPHGILTLRIAGDRDTIAYPKGADHTRRRSRSSTSPSTTSRRRSTR